MISLLNRYRGALLGLACGDAVGTSVEFSPRGSFEPLTDMVGGGVFRLAPGQWTDDTSMALCLAASLIEKDGFDAFDQMRRYEQWHNTGYMSSNGRCFDIGMTVGEALARFAATGNPIAGSTDPQKAGNGSLMRLVPAVLYAYPNIGKVLQFAEWSSKTTHGAEQVLESCKLFAAQIAHILGGGSKQDLWKQTHYRPSLPHVLAIATGDGCRKSIDAIKGTGYSVESLDAALWCFTHTDTFEAAILTAANLGDDADTTAAITGQIAGAYYGNEGIPAKWLERLCMRTEIDAMAKKLFELSQAKNRHE